MSKFRRNLRGVALNWDAYYVVNMQRGPLTRLATARAILWYHLLRFRVQVNDPHIISVFYPARPLWMTIPHASQSCQELLKCGCKSERDCAERCQTAVYSTAPLHCRAVRPIMNNGTSDAAYEQICVSLGLITTSL